MDLSGLFKSGENIEEFQAGNIIFEENNVGSVMYVILEGEVEVRRGGKVIEVIKPGEIVGEMALIDGQYRSAMAVAKSNCRLAVVDEKRFLFMVQQTPFFALHVMRILVNRLRRTTVSQTD
jgi:CRP/FNR family transcriptional regulator, cyclic AMP receptor protein